MKPLQVYMDEADLARLEAWSRRHGMSKSQAVRAALRAAMRPEDRDPVFGLSGSVQGLPADASAAFDRYLQETFIAHPPRRTRAAKARVRR